MLNTFSFFFFFLRKETISYFVTQKHFKLVIPSWQLEKEHFTPLVKIDVLFFLSNYVVFK